MKYLFLFIIALLPVFGFSQEPDQEIEVEIEEPIKKHEIKTNLFYLALGGIELGYEFNFSRRNSVGISGMVPYSKDAKDDIKYYVAPYYRYFFGKKYASGFFLEGFGMLNKLENEKYDEPNSDESSEFVSDFAIGLGIGGKVLLGKGWLLEVNFGAGPNLAKVDKHNISVIAKGGVQLGYRF
ncbi:DUF3575 domain-containing protein [Aegicerativicinus sediminis]|uniref:DUF3575 domain-containing protein n=1 Tax=Aegicerativicinus sediminis TaxID=2893202 RepID=UPI001E2AEB70|nr:DUF3575 domain-containing protein [Aegicerativicinus sediminis]